MELFAIAKVSRKLGVSCRAVKYGSDLAYSDTPLDWSESLDKAKNAMSREIKNYLDVLGKPWNF